jgi:hypothetical protein
VPIKETLINRLCEERSDAAIQNFLSEQRWIATHHAKLAAKG